MKVITFQSKEVLDQILNIGVCYPIENIRFPNAPKTYQRLINDYNKKKHFNCKSLFYVWVKVFEDEELTIDDKHINRCNEMTNLPDDECVCLLLDVIPDNIVLVTSFYNYVDEMYAEEFPDELESIWDSIYNLEDGNHEQQGVIPYISKDMIIDSKIVNKPHHEYKI